MLETIVFVLLRLMKLFPRCRRTAARRLIDGVFSDGTIGARGENRKDEKEQRTVWTWLANASPHLTFSNKRYTGVPNGIGSNINDAFCKFQSTGSCPRLFHISISQSSPRPVASLKPIATVIPSGSIVDPARARRMSPEIAGGFRGNAI